MKAALSTAPPDNAPNLEKWLHHSTTAVFRLQEEGPLDDRWEKHNQLSQLNVLVQIEHLHTYPIISERVRAGTLKLCGWWFEIATGEMFAYEKSSRSFEAITDESANRLIEQLATKHVKGEKKDKSGKKKSRKR